MSLIEITQGRMGLKNDKTADRKIIKLVNYLKPIPIVQIILVKSDFWGGKI